PHASLAAGRDPQCIIEVETDAALRRQRHGRAGVDERELRRLRREERVLQTKGLEHAAQVADRLTQLWRARAPGIGLAEALERIGEQGADSIPLHASLDVCSTEPDSRRHIQLHDAHELQESPDLEAMAQQVLDDAVVEQIAPDRL